MISGIDVNVKGLEELVINYTEFADDLTGTPIKSALREATSLVTADARVFAPANEGRLRGSIVPSVEGRGSETVGIVGSNVFYSIFMEEGTKHTRMPPYGPGSSLEIWSRRKGLNAYLVARAILRRGGLRARRYLERALDKNKRHIIDIIDQAVAQMTREANR